MLLFTGDSPKHFTAECAHLEMNIGPPTFNSNRAAAIYLNSGVTSGVYCEVNGLAMLSLNSVLCHINGFFTWLNQHGVMFGASM